MGAVALFCNPISPLSVHVYSPSSVHVYLHSSVSASSAFKVPVGLWPVSPSWLALRMGRGEWVQQSCLHSKDCPAVPRTSWTNRTGGAFVRLLFYSC
jgi:hypothetical protein